MTRKHHGAERRANSQISTVSDKDTVPLPSENVVRLELSLLPVDKTSRHRVRKVPIDSVSQTQLAETAEGHKKGIKKGAHRTCWRPTPTAHRPRRWQKRGNALRQWW